MKRVFTADRTCSQNYTPVTMYLSLSQIQNTEGTISAHAFSTDFFQYTPLTTMKNKTKQKNPTKILS